ncbi:MAG: putative eukaryotic translation initiation factor 3 subunit E [Streblomastix strix]|uniref:Putative eukaryotic translation initiation factor 3 subunit E n=1 Tax=Streblomastix strix TaxID=222440 RepID=A0A5J4WSP9_9EUKA|nr:MAG: putative eukaryotic translation initiation factor 3 subunit E [Streblomastix strix]
MKRLGIEEVQDVDEELKQGQDSKLSKTELRKVIEENRKRKSYYKLAQKKKSEYFEQNEDPIDLEALLNEIDTTLPPQERQKQLQLKVRKILDERRWRKRRIREDERVERRKEKERRYTDRKERRIRQDGETDEQYEQRMKQEDERDQIEREKRREQRKKEKEEKKKNKIKKLRRGGDDDEDDDDEDEEERHHHHKHHHIKQEKDGSDNEQQSHSTSRSNKDLNSQSSSFSSSSSSSEYSSSTKKGVLGRYKQHGYAAIWRDDYDERMKDLQDFDLKEFYQIEVERTEKEERERKKGRDRQKDMELREKYKQWRKKKEQEQQNKRLLLEERQMRIKRGQSLGNLTEILKGYNFKQGQGYEGQEEELLRQLMKKHKHKHRHSKVKHQLYNADGSKVDLNPDNDSRSSRSSSYSDLDSLFHSFYSDSDSILSSSSSSSSLESFISQQSDYSGSNEKDYPDDENLSETEREMREIKRKEIRRKRRKRRKERRQLKKQLEQLVSTNGGINDDNLTQAQKMDLIRKRLELIQQQGSGYNIHSGDPLYLLLKQVSFSYQTQSQQSSLSRNKRSSRLFSVPNSIWAQLGYNQDQMPGDEILEKQKKLNLGIGLMNMPQKGKYDFFLGFGIDKDELDSTSDRIREDEECNEDEEGEFDINDDNKNNEIKKRKKQQKLRNIAKNMFLSDQIGDKDKDANKDGEGSEGMNKSDSLIMNQKNKRQSLFKDNILSLLQLQIEQFAQYILLPPGKAFAGYILPPLHRILNISNEIDRCLTMLQSVALLTTAQLVERRLEITSGQKEYWADYIQNYQQKENNQGEISIGFLYIETIGGKEIEIGLYDIQGSIKHALQQLIDWYGTGEEGGLNSILKHISYGYGNVQDVEINQGMNKDKDNEINKEDEYNIKQMKMNLRKKGLGAAEIDNYIRKRYQNQQKGRIMRGLSVLKKNLRKENLFDFECSDEEEENNKVNIINIQIQKEDLVRQNLHMGYLTRMKQINIIIENSNQEEVELRSKCPLEVRKEIRLLGKALIQLARLICKEHQLAHGMGNRNIMSVCKTDFLTLKYLDPRLQNKIIKFLSDLNPRPDNLGPLQLKNLPGENSEKALKEITAKIEEKADNPDAQKPALLWGKFCFELLLQRWGNCKETFAKIDEIIDNYNQTSASSTQSQQDPIEISAAVLLQRTWLAHWYLFYAFQAPDQQFHFAEWIFQEKNLPVLNSCSPHLLQYAIASSLITKQKVGRSQILLREAQKAVQFTDKEVSKDPLSQFIRALLLDGDVETASELIKTCEDDLYPRDFFLHQHKDDLITAQKELVIEILLRTRTRVLISEIQELLHIDDQTAANRLLLNASTHPRTTYLDAHIDFEGGEAYADVWSNSAYRQVVDKTKVLPARLATLAAQLERRQGAKQ